jgi:hypothetical protein
MNDFEYRFHGSTRSRRCYSVRLSYSLYYSATQKGGIDSDREKTSDNDVGGWGGYGGEDSHSESGRLTSLPFSKSY